MFFWIGEIVCRGCWEIFLVVRFIGNVFLGRKFGGGGGYFYYLRGSFYFWILFFVI